MLPTAILLVLSMRSITVNDLNIMSVEENTLKDKMNIEELFTELEETILKLNNSDVSLEQSFALYEKGMKLAAQCEKEIDTVEKKVLEISERGTVSEFT